MRLHGILQFIICEAAASLCLQVDDVRCNPKTSTSMWTAAHLCYGRHHHNSLHTLFTVVAACHVDHAAAPNAIVTNDDLFSWLQQVGDAGLHTVVTCTLTFHVAGPK